MTVLPARDLSRPYYRRRLTPEVDIAHRREARMHSWHAARSEARRVSPLGDRSCYALAVGLVAACCACKAAPAGSCARDRAASDWTAALTSCEAELLLTKD